ncbi:ThuA domain-containing protein [Phytomonospora endophytica]|uniref:Type 1 glutamine amidotransferase n=1 Tax=Phytomonospora endophytica TaxID=714109 RepID=A0A841FS77_9ACTN|nr:ThuA domain-containing protein [Phytomonospora endophytica]MBB6039115.1 type 1 glutamine amidotransferase [Phytomonospora endophytica]
MRLLIFSKTTGFRHDSIPTGVAAVEALAAANGYATDATEDAGAFTPENLARYAAVVFLSTSGALFDDAQKAALKDYVERGGGYVGIHAASTTEYDWPWYGELVGARFTRHPRPQDGVIHIEDGDHDSTKHLGATWPRFDEWYEFAENPRGRVSVLLTVDESSYEGAEMGADHPLAWFHEIGGGKAFYTALGHTHESFAEPEFLAHVLGGIRYATGV